MADIFDLFKQIAKQNTAPSAAPTHIIAGLGNPGKEYERTRHNAGFMAMDHLSAKLGVSVSRLKFKALCGEAQIGSHRVLLMKPQTFMNLSGDAISEAASFYKIPPENILILVDDVCQDTGRMRVRQSGRTQEADSSRRRTSCRRTSQACRCTQVPVRGCHRRSSCRHRSSVCRPRSLS